MNDIKYSNSLPRTFRTFCDLQEHELISKTGYPAYIRRSTGIVEAITRNHKSDIINANERKITVQTVLPTTRMKNSKDHEKCTKVKRKMKKNNQRLCKKSKRTKPLRPLSAYNFFFRYERARLIGENKPKVLELLDTEPRSYTVKKKRLHRKTHGKIGFMPLVKHIGQAWNQLDDSFRAFYDNLAAEDMKRYRKDIKIYKKMLRVEKRDSKVAKCSKVEEGADSENKKDLDSTKNSNSKLTNCVDQNSLRKNDLSLTKPKSDFFSNEGSVSSMLCEVKNHEYSVDTTCINQNNGIFSEAQLAQVTDIHDDAYYTELRSILGDEIISILLNLEDCDPNEINKSTESDQQTPTSLDEFGYQPIFHASTNSAA